MRLRNPPLRTHGESVTVRGMNAVRVLSLLEVKCSILVYDNP